MASAVRFEDPARQSQTVFRSVMTAMSMPGRIEAVPTIGADGPLPGCMADLALALCDFETPVWLDTALAVRSGVAEWFRFQTGAPIVRSPNAASFAFIADSLTAPSLESFSLGVDEYPDRSTTLLLAVERLAEEGPYLLVGPGVKGATRFDVGPLRDGFVGERATIRALFPRGVDLIFVCGDRIAALPRTTIVEE
jgi:alpha-D-ribose 1-methylphosphonate 5-triphosphate synthase subunit PhnH